jgi:hypothetical protein
MFERAFRTARKMDKGYPLSWRKSMSSEDRRTFDRWLKGNATVGAIFAAGLVAMAVLGSHRATPPDGTFARASTTADLVASHVQIARGQSV